MINHDQSQHCLGLRLCLSALFETVGDHIVETAGAFPGEPLLAYSWLLIPPVAGDIADHVNLEGEPLTTIKTTRLTSTYDWVRIFTPN